MKPDKHKKKNSEQYMRKHNGSGTDGSASREVHVKHKQDRATAVSGKGQRIESTITEPHHSASSGFQKSENFSDVKTDSTKYNRRKIESNWQKYEVDSTDGEEVTMRGADYFELVQFNKYVLPEFQFDNFNDTSCETADTEENDDFSKFMSIDCEMLSFALRCVPLCQRLDIDESLFDESKLKALEKDASDQLKGYQAFLDSRNTASACDNSSHTVVTGMNKMTLHDLAVDPSVSSCKTEVTDILLTGDVMPSDFQTADVECGSERGHSSQNQTEAVTQVSVGTTSSLPELNEDSATSDSYCKQQTYVKEVTARHPSESAASCSHKLEETLQMLAIAETNARPTSVITSVNDFFTDSASLAELEDELDSLLGFDRTLPAPLCING